MSGPDFGLGFFVGSLFATVVLLGFGTSLTNVAKEQVKQQTINYCVETPQKCKLEYNYFKMKETQTK